MASEGSKVGPPIGGHSSNDTSSATQLLARAIPVTRIPVPVTPAQVLAGNFNLEQVYYRIPADKGMNSLSLVPVMSSLARNASSLSQFNPGTPATQLAMPPLTDAASTSNIANKEMERPSDVAPSYVGLKSLEGEALQKRSLQQPSKQTHYGTAVGCSEQDLTEIPSWRRAAVKTLYASNYVYDKDKDCDCSSEEAGEEVPMEQIFIEDGNMLRIPYVTTLRLGGNEVCGFYKQHKWYVSLAELFAIVGDGLKRVFEKTYSFMKPKLDKIKADAREFELLRQQDRVPRSTKYKELLSLDSVQRLCESILQLSSDEEIVQELAAGPYTKKEFGSQVKCTTCGLRIDKGFVDDVYSIIWQGCTDSLNKNRQETSKLTKTLGLLGSIEVSSVSFVAISLKGNIYISLKQIMFYKLFSLTKLQSKLVQLKVKAIRAPKELEHFFTSDTVSNTLWIDMVSMRCIACMLVKTFDGKRGKILKDMQCGEYTFTKDMEMEVEDVTNDRNIYTVDPKTLEISESAVMDTPFFLGKESTAETGKKGNDVDGAVGKTAEEGPSKSVSHDSKKVPKGTSRKKRNSKSEKGAFDGNDSFDGKTELDADPEHHKNLVALLHKPLLVEKQSADLASGKTFKQPYTEKKDKETKTADLGPILKKNKARRKEIQALKEDETVERRRGRRKGSSRKKVCSTLTSVNQNADAEVESIDLEHLSGIDRNATVKSKQYDNNSVGRWSQGDEAWKISSDIKETGSSEEGKLPEKSSRTRSNENLDERPECAFAEENPEFKLMSPRERSQQLQKGIETLKKEKLKTGKKEDDKWFWPRGRNAFKTVFGQYKPEVTKSVTKSDTIGVQQRTVAEPILSSTLVTPPRAGSPLPLPGLTSPLDSGISSPSSVPMEWSPLKVVTSTWSDTVCSTSVTLSQVSDVTDFQAYSSSSTSSVTMSPIKSTTHLKPSVANVPKPGAYLVTDMDSFTKELTTNGLFNMEPSKLRESLSDGSITPGTYLVKDVEAFRKEVLSRGVIPSTQVHTSPIKASPCKTTPSSQGMTNPSVTKLLATDSGLKAVSKGVRNVNDEKGVSSSSRTEDKSTSQLSPAKPALSAQLANEPTMSQIAVSSQQESPQRSTASASVQQPTCLLNTAELSEDNLEVLQTENLLPTTPEKKLLEDVSISSLSSSFESPVGQKPIPCITSFLAANNISITDLGEVSLSFPSPASSLDIPATPPVSSGKTDGPSSSTPVTHSEKETSSCVKELTKAESFSSINLDALPLTEKDCLFNLDSTVNLSDSVDKDSIPNEVLTAPSVTYSSDVTSYPSNTCISDSATSVSGSSVVIPAANRTISISAGSLGYNVATASSITCSSNSISPRSVTTSVACATVSNLVSAGSLTPSEVFTSAPDITFSSISATGSTTASDGIMTVSSADVGSLLSVAFSSSTVADSVALENNLTLSENQVVSKELGFSCLESSTAALRYEGTMGVDTLTFAGMPQNQSTESTCDSNTSELEATKRITVENGSGNGFNGDDCEVLEPSAGCSNVPSTTSSVNGEAASTEDNIVHASESQVTRSIPSQNSNIHTKTGNIQEGASYDHRNTDSSQEESLLGQTRSEAAVSDSCEKEVLSESSTVQSSVRAHSLKAGSPGMQSSSAVSTSSMIKSSVNRKSLTKQMDRKFPKKQTKKKDVKRLTGPKEPEPAEQPKGSLVLQSLLKLTKDNPVCKKPETDPPVTYIPHYSNTVLSQLKPRCHGMLQKVSKETLKNENWTPKPNHDAFSLLAFSKTPSNPSLRKSPVQGTLYDSSPQISLRQESTHDVVSGLCHLASESVPRSISGSVSKSSSRESTPQTSPNQQSKRSPRSTCGPVSESLSVSTLQTSPNQQSVQTVLSKSSNSACEPVSGSVGGSDSQSLSFQSNPQSLPSREPVENLAGVSVHSLCQSTPKISPSRQPVENFLGGSTQISPSQQPVENLSGVSVHSSCQSTPQISPSRQPVENLLDGTTPQTLPRQQPVENLPDGSIESGFESVSTVKSSQSVLTPRRWLTFERIASSTSTTEVLEQLSDDHSETECLSPAKLDLLKSLSLENVNPNSSPYHIGNRVGAEIGESSPVSWSSADPLSASVTVLTGSSQGGSTLSLSSTVSESESSVTLNDNRTVCEVHVTSGSVSDEGGQKSLEQVKKSPGRKRHVFETEKKEEEEEREACSEHVTKVVETIKKSQTKVTENSGSVPGNASAEGQTVSSSELTSSAVLCDEEESLPKRGWPKKSTTLEADRNNLKELLSETSLSAGLCVKDKEKPQKHLHEESDKAMSVGIPDREGKNSKEKSLQSLKEPSSNKPVPPGMHVKKKTQLKEGLSKTSDKTMSMEISDRNRKNSKEQPLQTSEKTDKEKKEEKVKHKPKGKCENRKKQSSSESPIPEVWLSDTDKHNEEIVERNYDINKGLSNYPVLHDKEQSEKLSRSASTLKEKEKIVSPNKSSNKSKFKPDALRKRKRRTSDENLSNMATKATNVSPPKSDRKGNKKSEPCSKSDEIDSCKKSQVLPSEISESRDSTSSHKNTDKCETREEMFSKECPLPHDIMYETAQRKSDEILIDEEPSNNSVPRGEKISEKIPVPISRIQDEGKIVSGSKSEESKLKTNETRKRKRGSSDEILPATQHKAKNVSPARSDIKENRKSESGSESDETSNRMDLSRKTETSASEISESREYSEENTTASSHKHMDKCETRQENCSKVSPTPQVILHDIFLCKHCKGTMKRNSDEQLVSKWLSNCSVLQMGKVAAVSQSKSGGKGILDLDKSRKRKRGSSDENVPATLTKVRKVCLSESGTKESEMLQNCPKFSKNSEQMDFSKKIETSSESGEGADHSFERTDASEKIPGAPASQTASSSKPRRSPSSNSVTSTSTSVFSESITFTPSRLSLSNSEKSTLRKTPYDSVKSTPHILSSSNSDKSTPTSMSSDGVSSTPSGLSLSNSVKSTPPRQTPSSSGKSKRHRSSSSKKAKSKPTSTSSHSITLKPSRLSILNSVQSTPPRQTPSDSVTSASCPKSSYSFSSAPLTPASSNTVASVVTSSKTPEAHSARFEQLCTELATLQDKHDPNKSLQVLAAIAEAVDDGDSRSEEKKSLEQPSSSLEKTKSVAPKLPIDVSKLSSAQKSMLVAACRQQLEELLTNIRQCMEFSQCKGNDKAFKLKMRFKPGAEKVFPELTKPENKERRQQFVVVLTRFLASQYWKTLAGKRDDRVGNL